MRLELQQKMGFVFRFSSEGQRGQGKNDFTDWLSGSDCAESINKLVVSNSQTLADPDNFWTVKRFQAICAQQQM